MFKPRHLNQAFQNFSVRGLEICTRVFLLILLGNLKPEFEIKRLGLL